MPYLVFTVRLILLKSEVFFLIHLKLELIMQIPALDDENKL